MRKYLLNFIFAVVSLGLLWIPVSAASPLLLAPISGGLDLTPAHDFPSFAALREAPDFTDTAGTICENAAALCCRTGLMDGADPNHFLPECGMTNAQSICVCARLSDRLSGGDLSRFAGADDVLLYDRFLTEQFPDLAAKDWFRSMRENASSGCSRADFFRLLSAILKGSPATLPTLNMIFDTPDCTDESILLLYRWGILQGKDEYGTFYGNAALTRAAAAASLARLIDPVQRLSFKPAPFELCRLLLDADPSEILLTVGDRPISAAEFMPILVESCQSYNHSHFYALTLEQNGKTVLDDALDTLRDHIRCEQLAESLNLELPVYREANTMAKTHGLTEHGRAWAEYHQALSAAVHAVTSVDQLPAAIFVDGEAAIPEDIAARVQQLPYWGGTF